MQKPHVPSSAYHRIIEYPELEGTQKDHQVQLLDLHTPEPFLFLCRQQHIDSPQMENTDSGEVQCEYYLLPRGKPQAASAHRHPVHLYMQSHHFISHWDMQTPCPFFKARFLSSTSRPTSSLHAECVRLHKGHGSIPVLPGTKPICLGVVLSHPFRSQAVIPPLQPLLLSFLQFSSEAFLLQELHKAQCSSEGCGCVLALLGKISSSSL